MNTEKLDNPLLGSWKWLLVFALVLIVLGIFAIANPLATIIATSMMLAISLLIIGAMSLGIGLSAKGVAGRWVDIVFGILAILGGILTFTAPIEGALTLVWTLGALYAVTGVVELLGAFRATQNRGWLMVMGVIDVVLGFWIMFMLPGTALLTLAFIVGLGFIIRGALLAYASLQMRRLLG